MILIIIFTKSPEEGILVVNIINILGDLAFFWPIMSLSSVRRLNEQCLFTYLRNISIFGMSDRKSVSNVLVVSNTTITTLVLHALEHVLNATLIGLHLTRTLKACGTTVRF